MGAARPTVRTTCPYCGVGCGVRRPSRWGRRRGGRRRPGAPGQLRPPLLQGRGARRDPRPRGPPAPPQIDGGRVTWDAALDAVADGFRRTIAAHGPEAVAFYLSGQLLTEDYYVANKLAKGFLGTPHVDTNSRLCMASSVAGHRRAFGSDIVPGRYEDLDEADLLVLVGSNAAWCHPVLFRRMEAARAPAERRIVAVDPRRTATTEEADLHLSLAPGTDAVLFGGLLVELARRGGSTGPTSPPHDGFAAALARAREIAPDATPRPPLRPAARRRRALLRPWSARRARSPSTARA